MSVLDDDYSNMSIDDMFDEIIDWSHETKKRDAGDTLHNMGYIQAYIDEIRKRCLADICTDE